MNGTKTLMKTLIGMTLVSLVALAAFFMQGDVTTALAASEDAVIVPVDGTLSADEADALIYMREEEKLARDVYLVLYDQWGLSVFTNIANSEQAHMDAVKMLLDTYGLTDPADSNAVGVFTNPDLQALYDQLVAQGSQSISDALKVGAAIEEIDILDLEERLAQTDNEDIQLVFENLISGSRNHLRAFTSTLQAQTGEVYQPQYLTQDVYDAIVSTGFGTGGNGRGNGGARGGRRP